MLRAWFIFSFCWAPNRNVLPFSHLDSHYRTQLPSVPKLLNKAVKALPISYAYKKKSSNVFQEKKDRLLSGKWGYLEYICGHTLCHSLLSASPAQKNGFSYAAAAVTVWILNSHKPYGVAGQKKIHTFSHGQILFLQSINTSIYMSSWYSCQLDAKKIISFQMSRLPANIWFRFLEFGCLNRK